MGSGNQFADLAPRAAEVPLRGKAITVHPLTLAQIGVLVGKYKRLAGALDGGDIVQLVLTEGDGVVAEIIAMATRSPVEAVAGIGLNASEQASLLTAIIGITLPEDDNELGEVVTRASALIIRMVRALGPVLPRA